MCDKLYTQSLSAADIAGSTGLTSLFERTEIQALRRLADRNEDGEATVEEVKAYIEDFEALTKGGLANDYDGKLSAYEISSTLGKELKKLKRDLKSPSDIDNMNLIKSGIQSVKKNFQNDLSVTKVDEIKTNLSNHKASLYSMDDLEGFHEADVYQFGNCFFSWDDDPSLNTSESQPKKVVDDMMKTDVGFYMLDKANKIYADDGPLIVAGDSYNHLLGSKFDPDSDWITIGTNEDPAKSPIPKKFDLNMVVLHEFAHATSERGPVHNAKNYLDLSNLFVNVNHNRHDDRREFERVIISCDAHEYDPQLSVQSQIYIKFPIVKLDNYEFYEQKTELTGRHYPNILDEFESISEEHFVHVENDYEEHSATFFEKIYCRQSGIKMPRRQYSEFNTHEHKK